MTGTTWDCGEDARDNERASRLNTESSMSSSARSRRRSSGGSEGTAKRRLQGALNAHSAVEVQVVFPTLHGLHSELAEKVRGLERDHERFRKDVDRLALAIVAADITTARRVLEEFDAALSAHERSEERILENV